MVRRHPEATQGCVRPGLEGRTSSERPYNCLLPEQPVETEHLALVAELLSSVHLADKQLGSVAHVSHGASPG